MKKLPISKHHVYISIKFLFWFGTGILLGLFFTVSFAYIFFQRMYGNKIYPGVYVNGINLGGKTPSEAMNLFAQQNAQGEKSTFTFTYQDQTATISAKAIDAGYNAKLLTQQAYGIARSNYLLSDIILIFRAYLNGLMLSPSYHYDDEKLAQALLPITQKATVEPVDAEFSFVNNRVSTFKLSSDGQTIDMNAIKQSVGNKVPEILMMKRPIAYTLLVPIKVLKPKISSESINNYGIKQLLGTGDSQFQGSIPSRIYNVELAASRLNGVLISPGEEFSFDKALGDVSSYTGYKQAYVIQNGHTILGDGGGVCQVSTTFFRALLNAGLPINERHAHDYLVEYYTEGGYPPGIDATVYVPSVDLKFTNDTGHWILVQSVVDPATLHLQFNLYGMSDGRKVSMTTPVVTNVQPAPPPLYQDDPTLPVGQVVQTDFAAVGETVTFSRTVTRNNQIIISDTYTSNYHLWQAVFMRGTKT